MNKRLLILSGLSILAVAANHASLEGFVAMIWWTDRYLPVTVPNYDQVGSFAYYGLVAAQKLALFSVPSFLFISGVFLAYLARGSRSRLTWGVIRRRILNLLPPFVIWTTAFLLSRLVIGQRMTPLEFVLNYITIEASAFFFIPLIIVYYVLSLWLVPVARDHWKLLLSVSGMLLLGAILRGYLDLFNQAGMQNPTLEAVRPFLPNRAVLYTLFYYALGLVTGFYTAQMKPVLFRLRWVLLAVVVVSGILAVVEAEWAYRFTGTESWRTKVLTLPTAIYIVSFILTFLGFDRDDIPFSKQVYRLGVDTLGIYLIHETVLLFAPKIVYHLLPPVLGIQAIYQPILIAFAVGIPLLMMTITRRTPLKRFYRVLYG